MKILKALALLLCCSLYAAAQRPAKGRAPASTPEQRAAQRFESLRKSPPQMLAFLLGMPKGGDLHNHLSGAVYAESFIQWAADKGLCVNQTSMTLSEPPCDRSASRVPVGDSLKDPVLYRRLVDAWSMRYWQFSGQNAHDQFFDTFGKFGPAGYGQTAQMLAEVLRRAARGRVYYMELMLTTDDGASGRIGSQVGWDGDPASTLRKLKAAGIDVAAEAGAKALAAFDAEKDRLLRCGTPQAEAACDVTVRYVWQVARASEPASAFAQMVTGFALADASRSKVVALNLVQPEDWLVPMRDFSLHMEMIKYLRSQYPGAHLTLHAGELAPGIVPPEGLTFHIRDSVLKAGAERIGHGVDVMHEDDPYGLMKEMARRGVMVEVCLTSNDTILGVKGEQHPLATYLENGVPVALATDDEGVSRSEMSREYLKAAQEHGLGYRELKKIARTSLQYAFLPGPSLWADPRKFIPVKECVPDATATLVTGACERYVRGSEKARLQLRLERQFHAFEAQF